VSGRKLRAGVIGCGIGADHGYAYKRVPDFELVAICDINPQAFARFYERSGVAPGTVKEYTDYRELLANEQLDVVSVATPDEYHTDPVCAAADAGIKGILCEKPLASSLADADRIVAAVERNGTKMSVDHTRSWYPTFQAVRKEIRAGAIGPLTRIVSHMGGHRSMLFRNGTHIVDAMGYFAESRPVWVIAAHERGFENYGTEYKGEGGKDPMLDPGSTVIVEYENGVRGILNSAKNTPAIFEIDLLGPNGRYWLTQTGGAAWRTETPEGVPQEAPAPWQATAASSLGENLIPAVQELAQMVLHDAPSSSPPQRARDVMEIMFGALLSQSRDSAKVQLPLPRG
jgi:predicted dehydrogenase